MSGYQWQGSGQHGAFVRAGSRQTQQPADLARDHALYEQMAAVSFWCDTCHRSHPLREHRTCRRPR